MKVGWVSLWRKMWDNPRSTDPEWVAVWIWLLHQASHKEMDVIWEGKRMTLMPGQLITGRNKIAANTGVHPSKVYRLLKRYASEQQIKQVGGRTSSLISILNWHKYQFGEQGSEQRMNNERTTSEQPANTNNNINNVNKDIHTHCAGAWEGGTDEVFQEIAGHPNMSGLTYEQYLTALKDYRIGPEDVRKNLDWLMRKVVLFGSIDAKGPWLAKRFSEIERGEKGAKNVKKNGGKKKMAEPVMGWRRRDG